MSERRTTPIGPAPPPQSADAIAALQRVAEGAEELRARVEQLLEENEGLANEVLRAYEQLNIIFEFTQQIAHLIEPDQIERTLLKHLSEALPTRDLLVLPEDGSTCCVRAHDETRLESLTQQVRARAQTQAPSSARRVEVLAIDGREVLLGSIVRLSGRADLVVAAQPPDTPSFTSGEMSVIESLLAFGGQIVSNSELHAQLASMSVEVTRALVAAIDQKDHYTSGHSERVGLLVKLIAQELNVSGPELQDFEWAGLLHDVGKIGVPEEILRKPGKLTPEEFAAVKRHPEMGYEILKPIARFQAVLDGVLYHHENPDGSGYPRGLAGEAIPFVARIIHVADVFDALSSSRSYRAAFTVEQACDIVRKEAGTKLASDVVEAFFRALERFRSEQPEEFARSFRARLEEGQ